MSNDISQIKHRLREYLNLKGILVLQKSSNNVRCPHPNHADLSPTATCYAKGKNSPYPKISCPICGGSWNIFDVAGLLEGLQTDDFQGQLKAVKNTLGIIDDMPDKTNKPIALDEENFRKIYDIEFIDKKGIEKEWGVRVGSWRYYDRNNKIVAIDIRYENSDKKKMVITWWYDGKLKWYSAPVIIYNLFEAINSDKPILISEGAKCAEISRRLEYFTPASWNGGSGKAHLVDWSALKNKEIFILRDNDEPGLKASLEIQKQLPHAKIITPPTHQTGDDVEQFLEHYSTEELTDYILTSKYYTVENSNSGPSDSNSFHENLLDENTHLNTPADGSFFESSTFKVLGIGEDNKAHFITECGRHVNYTLESLNKDKLRVIANRNYWKGYYQEGKATDWETALDDVTRLSERKDFDIKRLKGRGAWRTGENVCYNDGLKIYGTPDENLIYLKLSRENMGLESKPASRELLFKIRDTMFDLSFETKTDAVRVMGWSALAWMAGALQYRPTLLLTGESGHGKTKVQTLFIKKLTNFIHADMRATSEAGIRRAISKDSRAIFFDEGGKENDRMKLNFEHIMGFIRSNYSDESPDGFKAAMNGDGVVSYKLNSMFGLATTDPTIDNVQDENRILRVHFVKPKHTVAEWQKIETELENLMSVENCNAIRALVWSRFKTITCLTKKIVGIAKDKTKRDYRSSYADMLLASAYMVIWCDTENPTDEQIESMLDKYYQYQPIEENRNESEEHIDRILDEIIECSNKERREKITLREIAYRAYHKQDYNEEGQLESWEPPQISEYKRTLKMYGIHLMNDGLLHFANKNHMIQKITGLGDGYGKLFTRHKGFVKYEKPVTYQGKSIRGTVIKGLINKKTDEEIETEELGKVF